MKPITKLLWGLAVLAALVLLSQKDRPDEEISNYDYYSGIWNKPELFYEDDYSTYITYPENVRVELVDKQVITVNFHHYLCVVTASEMPIGPLWTQINALEDSATRSNYRERLQRVIQVSSIASRSYALSWKASKHTKAAKKDKVPLYDLIASPRHCQDYDPAKYRKLDQAARSFLSQAIRSVQSHVLLDRSNKNRSDKKNYIARACYARTTHLINGQHVPAPIGRNASLLPSSSACVDPLAPTEKSNKNMFKMGLSQNGLMERCFGYRMRSFKIDFDDPLVRNTSFPLYSVQAYLAEAYYNFKLFVSDDQGPRLYNLSEIHSSLHGYPAAKKLKDTIVVSSSLTGLALNMSSENSDSYIKILNRIDGSNRSHSGNHDGSGPEVVIPVRFTQPGSYIFTIRAESGDPQMSAFLYGGNNEIISVKNCINVCSQTSVIHTSGDYLLLIESGGIDPAKVRARGFDNEMPPFIVSFNPS